MSSSVRSGSLVGQRMGKYEMLALLAIGGTAEIYLARIGGEAGFEKYVVVKCLLDHLADDADFVRMFLDEARLGAQLDHSNIVQTLELGQHQNRFYMVMEHLAGMSLAQLGRKTHERRPGGLIPIDIVIGLAAQACAGLHYAHQRSASDGSPLNIVHRDVSPQNLVVTFEGVLKIVDFGIAKAEMRQTETRSGTIKGKFAYMSPEQCMAEAIDRRTDVFALATVVHELLTARRLFKRASTYDTYQAILKGNVPPPSRYNSEVDPELDQVLLQALAFHKEERTGNAELLGESLLGWLHKRGRSVSAGEIARYVESVCHQELEEHAQHMRSLISGRKVSATDALRWDQEREASGQAESVSLGAAPLQAAALERGDYDEARGPEDPTRYTEDNGEAPQTPRPRGRGRVDDDYGDTHIEEEPIGDAQDGAENGFRVPMPVTGPLTASIPAPRGPGGTADFPPASLRPPAPKAGSLAARLAAEAAVDPAGEFDDTSQQMTKAGKRRADEATAAAGKPSTPVPGPAPMA
ncbi:MAG TPA: serine/threonine-protein kinase, partial [Kofleriaceae bacterium]|nr:serine/threonine-protein kinase [Kofleriaceae bacterium]